MQTINIQKKKRTRKLKDRNKNSQTKGQSKYAANLVYQRYTSFFMVAKRVDIGLPKQSDYTQTIYIICVHTRSLMSAQRHEKDVRSPRTLTPQSTSFQSRERLPRRRLHAVERNQFETFPRCWPAENKIKFR